ncbi:MAG: DUF1669 domain-containing protein [Chlamydiae bacterium]|nr:DUF1669 domain-containing protein [Chlamydiota bacterium]
MVLKKVKKLFFSIAIVALLGFYGYLIFNSLVPHFPKQDDPPILYSNQCRQDLKITALKALKEAKESIHLITFGLTDAKIIDLLMQKHKENLKMKVFYDKRSSPTLNLPQDCAISVKSKGLMHQKILVIDKKLVFLGSANMTPTSLSMHDNLMIGFYSPDIADFLIKKAPFSPANKKFSVGGQEMELWLLPDTQNKALEKVKSIIASAKVRIEVVMFTLTHPKLIDELIEAKKRNVEVKVVVDFHSGLGASAKAIKKLKENNVEIFLSKGPQLCHHKYICVDNQTLVSGSANWTKSAFNKNYDCFVILYDLIPDQKKFMKKLFQTIEIESTSLK